MYIQNHLELNTLILTNELCGKKATSQLELNMVCENCIKMSYLNKKLAFPA